MKRLKHITFLFLIITFTNIHSQNEFYNKGSFITVQSGGLIYIEGEFVNTDLGTNTGLISNSGIISVRDNWTNNSTSSALSPTTGIVTLYGGNQNIQGITPTTFNHLTLLGSGIKTLYVNTNIGGNTGLLDLTALPLDLNSHTLTLTNPLNTAISRTSGYIISETSALPGYGTVQWNIGNAIGNYNIPFGVSTTQYIPLGLFVTAPGIQTGAGNLSASTYPTNTNPSVNNRPLPTGVIDLKNNCFTEHAIKMLDRFWIINSNNYSSNPITHKQFTYRDSEWDATSGSSNSITENQLEGWYYTTNWNHLAGTGNVTANTFLINNNTNYGVFTMGEYKTLNTQLLNIDSVICYGQSNGIIQFASNHGYGTPTYSYNTVSSPDTLKNNLATGIYTITVTDIMGCKDTLNDLHLYQPAQLTLTLSANNYSLCLNDPFQLQASFSGGIKPYTLNWSTGLGNTGINTNTASVSYTPSTSNNYSLTLTDKNNCSISSNSVLVLVNPLPVISFSANPTQGCVPLVVNFNNTSAPTQTISSWLWSYGNGSTSTQSNTTYTYNTAGAFNVSLTATSDKGCINTTTKPAYIAVHSLPTALFTYTLANEADILNSEVNFTNTSINAGYSAHWYFGDGNTTNGNDYPTHQYLDTGYYLIKLVVENANHCLDTALSLIRINELSTLYVPNAFTPNDNGLNDIFTVSGVNFYEFNMMVFDRWGAKLFETNDAYKGWDGTFNGQACAQNVYVYKITYKLYSGKEKKHEKIIVGQITLLR